MKSSFAFNFAARNYAEYQTKDLIGLAVQFKRTFNLVFEGRYLDAEVKIFYSDQPGRPVASFDRIDFRDPEFIKAIEDYTIGSTRQILEAGAAKGIMTALKQILGPGVIDCLQTGRMLPQQNAPHVWFLPDDIPAQESSEQSASKVSRFRVIGGAGSAPSLRHA